MFSVPQKATRRASRSQDAGCHWTTSLLKRWLLSSEGARLAGVAKLSLRQARLAQAVEQMLGVLGALVEGQSPLYVDRVHGIDPEDLGCLSARLIKMPQLREIDGQPDVALAHVWGPGCKFAQRRQRFRILFQHIPGDPQVAGHPAHIKRIASHVRLDDLNGPCVFPRAN